METAPLPQPGLEILGGEVQQQVIRVGGEVSDSDKQKPEPDSVPDSMTDGKPDVLIPFSDSTPPTNAHRRGG